VSSPHTLVVAGDRVGPRMAGPSIRSFEMARALAERGLAVTLAAPGAPERAAPFPILGYDARGEALRAAAAGADAIVVQGLTLAQFPFLAAAAAPLVVDLYDPFVLENLHARLGETASGRVRSHATDLGALVAQLRRGDFFLCASKVQRDFWLGALTALGRVNPAVYDADASLRELIDVVPFGLPEAPPAAPERPVLRGVMPGIGAGDRIVLWGGGIWDWFDPLTLIRAVGEVDAERGDVRLVFMGTQTPSMYAPKQAMAARAEALARSLGLLGRAVFFNDGWVPYDARGGYLLEADLGASTHLDHAETRYAFRTRLLDCIWAGLPMLVTEGDVLADLVAEKGLGRTVPPEDVAATAAALRALLAEPGGRGTYAARFAAVRGALTWRAATEPLARFAAAPRPAPDRPRDARGATGSDGAATPIAQLPVRALELLRDGGPLLVLEEAVRYARWLRRPR